MVFPRRRHERMAITDRRLQRSGPADQRSPPLAVVPCWSRVVLRLRAGVVP